jgi:hypothetical protein
MFDTFTARPAFTAKPHEPHRRAIAPQGVPQRPAVVIVHRPMHPAWQPTWRR